jgi:hypothetical protein
VVVYVKNKKFFKNLIFTNFYLVLFISTVMTLAIDYWFPIALDRWFPNFSLYVVIVLINTTLWFKYVSYISDKELTIQ